MKLHRSLTNAVAEALHDIFQNNRFADNVVEKILRSNPKWGSRDRAFIAGQTYDCVRWWRLLWAIAGQEVNFKLPNLTRLIGINILLSSGRGYIFSGVPDAINRVSTVDTLLPDWPEFNGLDVSYLQSKIDELKNNRAIIQSVPDWLDTMAFEELGEVWDGMLPILNQPAGVFLRTNTLKTNTPELQRLLSESGWETTVYESMHGDSKVQSNTLLLHKRGNIFQNDYYKKGYFEIQDAGSQVIAPFTEVEAGMTVIDACAGAGGKTLHLAALMKNSGRIIALDTEAGKLEELRRRAQRNGVTKVETRVIDSPAVIKSLSQTADRLLLDVPCSGLGVLRRNPDAKWKLTRESVEAVKKTQRDILNVYPSMLKKGGKLTYATCSILPSENERQVADFLNINPDFTLIKELSLPPSEGGNDGFYMALMTRSL